MIDLIQIDDQFMLTLRKIIENDRIDPDKVINTC